MPPAIPIIAALGADALGATAGGLAADALGVGAGGILGTGITGAEVGGALAGGLEGGLMSHSLEGGLLGAVGGGLGGDALSAGVQGIGSSVGNALGLTSPATSGAAAAGDLSAGTSALGQSVPAAGATLPGAGSGGALAGAAPAGVAPVVDPTAASVAGTLTPGWNAGTSLGGQAIPSAAATSTPGTLATGPVAAGGGATAAAPLTSTPAAAATTSFDKLIQDPTWGNAWNVVRQNPSAVLGALGTGYELMNQGNIPGMKQLQSVANEQNRNSRELMSYVNSGQLPPGFQASMDQAKQAAKAQVRSKYASMGMSGSTAEAQDIANVDVNAVAAQAQAAAQLLQSGIQEGNVASDLLARIVGINQQEDQLTGAAISNFAAEMGGMPIYRVG